LIKYVWVVDEPAVLDREAAARPAGPRLAFGIPVEDAPRAPPPTVEVEKKEIFLAPGEERVRMRWKFEVDFARPQRDQVVTVDVFRTLPGGKPDPEPLDTFFATARHVGDDVYETEYGGTVSSLRANPDELPDGHLTAEFSPYRLRLTARGAT